MVASETSELVFGQYINTGLQNDFYYSSSLTLQDEVNTSSPTIVCDVVCECNGTRGKPWKDCQC